MLRTLEDFEESNCESWEEYASVGDEISEEIINNFIDMLPPTTLTQNLLQIGEMCSYKKDENGITRAIYRTFSKEKENWIYKGYCFKGETNNIK